MEKQKFTLIELVVIILVLAIATGMFIPVLSHAQKKAKSLSCIDKLKQISNVAFLYVENNDDYTVPHLAGKVRGWPRILKHTDSTLKDSTFHCPIDKVKRSLPISYSLNLGHIWNCKQSKANRKEWGPASVLNGASIRMSKVPQPSNTTWFFENHSINNSFRKLWCSGDRSLWGTYSLKGFHNNSTINNMLFMDGHIDGILAKSWVKGDNRGIIFKDIHTPKNCTPNIR